MIAFLGDEINL